MSLNLEDYIISITDYPKQGVTFRDITPLLLDADAFEEAIERLATFAKEKGAEKIVGPESRGFIFGCPVAKEIHAGFIPARKPGKLPRETVCQKYDLEYGKNEIHIHQDAIKPGDKVMIIDDLLATGGTALATAKIIEELGGEVVGCAFVIELNEDGRKLLKDYDICSLMQF